MGATRGEATDPHGPRAWLIFRPEYRSCRHSRLRPGAGPPNVLAYEIESRTDRFGPRRTRRSLPTRALQVDDLRPAGGGGLIEHSNLAHAGPPAQVAAAWRDNQPTAHGGAANRKDRFIDSTKTPHNP
jgi:hypothetical protein